MEFYRRCVRKAEQIIYCFSELNGTQWFSEKVNPIRMSMADIVLPQHFCLCVLIYLSYRLRTNLPHTLLFNITEALKGHGDAKLKNLREKYICLF